MHVVEPFGLSSFIPLVSVAEADANALAALVSRQRLACCQVSAGMAKNLPPLTLIFYTYPCESASSCTIWDAYAVARCRE